MDVDLGPVLATQLLKGDIHVQLSHAAQNHFLRLLVADKLQGGIFFNQLMQAQADLLDVGFGLGLKREGHGRFGQVEARIEDR